MKPQFGVCKNKVGCSFAYTGEKIPVPADSKCPECGQPLVVEASKQGGAKMLIVLAIVVLLLLIGGAAALFAFRSDDTPADGAPDAVSLHAEPRDSHGSELITDGKSKAARIDIVRFQPFEREVKTAAQRTRAQR